MYVIFYQLPRNLLYLFNVVQCPRLICLVHPVPLCLLVQGMDEEFSDAIEDTTVGIFVQKEQASSAEAQNIGIVLEGVKMFRPWIWTMWHWLLPCCLG